MTFELGAGAFEGTRCANTFAQSETGAEKSMRSRDLEEKQ